jgi:hypothetical protein
MRRMAVTFRMADCQCECRVFAFTALWPTALQMLASLLDVGSGSLGPGRSAQGRCHHVHTVRSAVVGDIRAARRAGSRPAIAPMVIAAPIPPAHPVVGMTTAQCLVLA